LQHIKHYVINNSRAFLDRNQGALRILVLVCLFAALAVNFSLLLAETPFAIRHKEKALSSFEGNGGVGGGISLENTMVEGPLDEAVSEEGVLEPESFSKPQMLLYSSYTVEKGDFIGNVAENFGLSQDTLISTNSIRNTRLIQIGQVLRVPNQDGIMYTVKNGDTLEKIAEKYKSDATAIQIANELFSDTALPGTALFIPGARLDWMERQEINGDLFIWPISGYITSPYGWRRWPFGGGRQFHSGIDIGGQPTGAPVRAAMSGRVSSAGWDNVLGNFVVITHHTGYRTMYGHLSVIRVKTGAYVGTGERIGDVGSTGMSTGPHVHFTVYKNGVTVNPRTLMK
jgi:murein DD-endopeptidase MepM/ murein hydrolase activator NlpD